MQFLVDIQRHEQELKERDENTGDYSMHKMEGVVVLALMSVQGDQVLSQQLKERARTCGPAVIGLTQK